MSQVGLSRKMFGGLALALVLLGACTSGPVDDQKPSKRADEEVLKADPRFDGDPVSEKSAPKVCEDIAAELARTGSFPDTPTAKYDADADQPCTLDNLALDKAQTKASAGVQFRRLDEDELATAADLLRDNKSNIIELFRARLV